MCQNTFQIRAFERLAEAEVCPPLIATFENGVVMEFFRGKMLNEKNIAERAVAKTVARAVAKMHRNVKLRESENSAHLVERIREFIELLPGKFSKTEAQNKVLEQGVRLGWPQTYQTLTTYSIKLVYVFSVKICMQI